MGLFLINGFPLKVRGSEVQSIVFDIDASWTRGGLLGRRSQELLSSQERAESSRAAWHSEKGGKEEMTDN